MSSEGLGHPHGCSAVSHLGPESPHLSSVSGFFGKVARLTNDMAAGHCSRVTDFVTSASDRLTMVESYAFCLKPWLLTMYLIYFV